MNSAVTDQPGSRWTGTAMQARVRRRYGAERRFRLAALRSERGELYHLRATRQISNETLQKLLHDLDLLEALLIEDQ